MYHSRLRDSNASIPFRDYDSFRYSEHSPFHKTFDLIITFKLTGYLDDSDCNHHTNFCHSNHFIIDPKKSGVVL